MERINDGSECHKHNERLSFCPSHAIYCNHLFCWHTLLCGFFFSLEKFPPLAVYLSFRLSTIQQFFFKQQKKSSLEKDYWMCFHFNALRIFLRFFCAIVLTLNDSEEDEKKKTKIDSCNKSEWTRDMTIIFYSSIK